MSEGQKKCRGCGSGRIEVDTAMAAVSCMDCGFVLESTAIVQDVQFEEGGGGPIGTFVSGDSKGGGGSGGLGLLMRSSGGGGGGGSLGRSGGPGGIGMVMMSGRESREITLRNAAKKIESLAQLLKLKRDQIDIACQFFRLALARNLTRGRKSAHVVAACIYITCRTEGTPHTLIDLSDHLRIDAYELGRTYLRLSQALRIKVPVVDPCIYVMRFAYRLDLGDKLRDVYETALRLVSRMKKDWIHLGRRPSGLCGAALLIACRLHAFNRSIVDIIKVVRVHESTLRKRLNEFGETMASQLTLDQFDTVDLESMSEDQDPPSFTAARKKDRELEMRKLIESGEIETELTELEYKIEEELEKLRAKLKNRGRSKLQIPSSTTTQKSTGDEDDSSVNAYIAEEVANTINSLVSENSTTFPDRDLMPPPPAAPAIPGLGLKDTIQEYLVSQKEPPNRENKDVEDEGAEEDCELDLEGIDDDEIDGYLMSKEETEYKTKMWMKANAEYLKDKEERDRKKAEEEAKDPKKSSGTQRKPRGSRTDRSGSSALEGFEKLVQEKKLSDKINYDVLLSLTSIGASKGGGNQGEPSIQKGTEDGDEEGQEDLAVGIFGESPIRTPSLRSSPAFAASSIQLGSKRPATTSSLKRKAPFESPSSSSKTPILDSKRQAKALPADAADASMAVQVSAAKVAQGGPQDKKQARPDQEGPSERTTTDIVEDNAEDNDEDNDEEEAEDEDDRDIGQLSAAHLLFQHHSSNLDDLQDEQGYGEEDYY